MPFRFIAVRRGGSTFAKIKSLVLWPWQRKWTHRGEMCWSWEGSWEGTVPTDWTIQQHFTESLINLMEHFRSQASNCTHVNTLQYPESFKNTFCLSAPDFKIVLPALLFIDPIHMGYKHIFWYCWALCHSWWFSPPLFKFIWKHGISFILSVSLSLYLSISFIYLHIYLSIYRDRYISLYIGLIS